jgi:hypothetical protein
MELLFIYAITWLFLCILVGRGAAKRGRSGILFFLLSLILSPLLVAIILLLLGGNTKVVEKKQLRSGIFKKCPHCAELVKSEALVCKHCKKELPLKVPVNDEDGTKLITAILNNETNEVKKLLESGANVNVEHMGTSLQGLARQQGNQEIAELLKQYT